MAWLRPARSTDAGAVGAILQAFQDETDWMPELWTGAELVASAGHMIDQGWVTVTGRTDHVEAFLARDGTDILALYVAGHARQTALGRKLLRQAKRRVDRLDLEVAEANGEAQGFYKSHGFVETGRGLSDPWDGGLPVLRYVWTKEAEV